MELAAQIGISITGFWQITPFELNIAAKGYAKRFEMENEASIKNGIYQAYLISRFVWQKEVDIKKYLNSKEKKKPMTNEEMLQRVKALNALFGGTINHGEGG